MAKESSKNIRGAEKPRWIIIVHFLFVIALLVIIQIAVSKEWINRIFLSSPTQILEELVYTIENNILWPHMLASLQEVGLGYLISAVGGILLGVLFVSFPTVEYLLSPIMSAIMAVPKTAVMPLLIVWFGIGFKSKVIMVILFCFFNVLFNTVTGAKQAQAGHLKVAKMFGASRYQTLVKILLPSALPSIFNGLRVTAATAITGVIFSEMTASKKGLGYLLSESQQVLNTPRLFLVIILVTVLSVILVGIVNLAERLICRRWHS